VLRNMIFDWSGTLIDDLPSVWLATHHVFDKAGVPPLTLSQFRNEFSLPFQKFYQRFLPHVPPQQLECWFHEKFKEVQDQVVEIPHARAFLQFCRSRGCRTFLLSTIHRSHYLAQAARTGFDQFIDRPYVEAWDKREWIHRVLKENQLKLDETVFIGDMVHDIETAHQGGVFSCAVLTGYTQAEALLASRPTLIVPHLGALQAILEQHQMILPVGGSGASGLRSLASMEEGKA
jgi:phosphoglycolate phosphatase